MKSAAEAGDRASRADSQTPPRLGWRTLAERFEGTQFTDRAFEHVPARAGVADLLSALMVEAT